MKVSEFESLLSKLTSYDLDEVRTKLYSQFNSSPTCDTGGTKPHNIRNFTYWVKGNTDRIDATLRFVREKLAEKAQYPVRGPVPSTRYIKWDELTKLPGYNELAEAIEFPHRPGASPMTKDGYISVHAIYNMSAWASWKSSSLSEYERAKANAIQKVRLGDLMQLNHGRIMNQPALFPVGMLK